MPVVKRPLVAARLRRPPAAGWSWIDRRFVRDYAPALSRDAMLLYFLLVAVSDKDGLSYYGEPSLAGHLRLSQEAVARARDELERHDLIAYHKPLYQVLSLPACRRQESREPTGAVASVVSQVARHFAREP
jgi:hypothetical protein